jgi:hypothetical protein
MTRAIENNHQLRPGDDDQDPPVGARGTFRVVQRNMAGLEIGHDYTFASERHPTGPPSVVRVRVGAISGGGPVDLVIEPIKKD